MPRSGRLWAEIRPLARELLRRADAREPGLVEKLRFDVEGAIRGRGDLIVHDQRPGTVVTGCVLGGAYVRHSPPALPRIVLAKTGFPRRDRFSLSHEFTHHLIDRDPLLADLLFTQPDHGHALEEDICNSAAAYVLVRGHDVDEALHIAGGVTAQAVQTLYQSSQGSLEVCCVALAHRMTGPGHILVFEPDHAAFNPPTPRFIARGPLAERAPPVTLRLAELCDAAMRSGAASGSVSSGTGVSRHPDGHIDLKLIDDVLVGVLLPLQD